LGVIPASTLHRDMRRKIRLFRKYSFSVLRGELKRYISSETLDKLLPVSGQ
jgi:hypothetical protein